jgi:FKBP-type peptidyl-prolyl cis-trans isomerase FkpA
MRAKAPSVMSPMSPLSTFVLVGLLAAGGACSKRVDEPASDFRPASGPPADPGPTTLQVTDEKVGTGPAIGNGQRARVHYTGTLMNGTKFDSSVGREPFTFTLGKGEVIKGWDQGVLGMKVGGKRKLVIPYALAYGEQGQPPSIPGKAALKFDIELLGID